MRKYRHLMIVALSLLVLSLGDTRAQVSSSKKPKAVKPVPAAKPKTHVVKTSSIKIEVTVSGVFESKQMSEVVLRPKEWSTLVVKEAVEAGKHVKKGETLVELDTKKIDEELNDLKYSRQLSALAVEQAELELRQLAESVPADLKSSRHSKQMADDDLAYFLKVDLDLRTRSAHESFKRSQYSLENAQEELKQLEQMYKADDLTEETEEIILKRARRSVESAQFFLETSTIRTARTLKTTLPREEIQLKEAARKQTLTLEKAESSLPNQLKQKEIGLLKLIDGLEKSELRFEQLKQDREQMTVKSPIDGIVYYGSCVRGKWSPTATVAKQLREGGTLAANQVFMTIVQTRPMLVRASLPEKELHHIRPGVKGKAVPTAFPNAKLPITVDSISQLPIDGGSFDVRIRFDPQDKATERIVPGMSCSVTLVAYQKRNAVTVPPSAVFSDELNEDQKFVYVPTIGGTHVMRDVVVGKTTDKAIEILEGLEPGEKILLEEPK